MSTEEEYGIPPGSVSCGYCGKQVATDEHIHECARRAESMRHYLMTERLDAARKVRDHALKQLRSHVYAAHMTSEGWRGSAAHWLADSADKLESEMDDAALRRIVEAGE